MVRRFFDKKGKNTEGPIQFLQKNYTFMKK
jgi:hypothetical protein